MRINRLGAFFACLATLGIASADTALDQLLRRVPDESSLVIAVPNVERLISGIAGFGDELGIDEWADLSVKKVTEEFELSDFVTGIDLTKPMVLTKSSTLGGPLFLCSLRDADAWRAAAHAESTDNGVLRITVFGDRAYAAVIDNVLAVAEQPEIVRLAVTSEGKRADTLKKHFAALKKPYDVVIWADVKDWQPMIEAALRALAMTMQMGMAMNSPPQHQDIVEFWRWFFGELGRLTRELDTWMLAGSIGQQGISLEEVAAFKSGGYAAEYVSKIKRTEGSLLRGLPTGDYMVAFGVEWETPPGTPNLTTEFTKALLSIPSMQEQIGSENFKKAMECVERMHGTMSGYGMGLLTQPDGSKIEFAGRYFSKTPDALIEQMSRAYEICPDMLTPLGPGAAIRVETSRTEINGQSAHLFDLNVTIAESEAQQIIETMYGKNLTVGVMPAKGGNDVVFAMSARDRVRDLLAANCDPQGKALVDDARIQTALKSISPEPQALVLIDVVRFLQFSLDLLRGMKSPVPAVTFRAKDTPLLAVGVYMRDNEVRAEVHVPAAPIAAIVREIRALKRGDDDY